MKILSADELQSLALGRVVRLLEPFFHGALLFGTRIDGAQNEWYAFQLSDDHQDCLQLAVLLPEAVCTWACDLLLDNVRTGHLTIDESAGMPAAGSELASATNTASTDLTEFFERWFLMGRFLTESDSLRTAILSHKPVGEEPEDYLFGLLSAVDTALDTYLESFGFKQSTPLIQRLAAQTKYELGLSDGPDFIT